MAKFKKPIKAKSASGLQYKVTIGGQCSVRTAAGLTSENYEVTCIMTQAMIDKGPLSVFKHYIADRELRVKFPGYERIVTHELTKPTERVDGDDPADIAHLEVMNIDQLHEYIEENGMPVESALYQDPGELRTAIKQCEEDVDTFNTMQDQLKEKKQDHFDMASEVASANPNLGKRKTIEIGPSAEPPNQKQPAKVGI